MSHHFAEKAPLTESDARIVRLNAALMEAQKLARQGTWVLGVDGLLVECSHEWLELMGVESLPDHAGTSFLLDQIHPEDRERLEGALQRVRMGLGVPPLEHRLLTAEGRIRWVVTRMKATLQRGLPTALISGSTQDVTEQHQASHALRQTQHLESLGVLAGGLSQDFAGLSEQLTERLAALKPLCEGDALPLVRDMEELLAKTTALVDQIRAYHATTEQESRLLALDALVDAMAPLLEAILPVGARLVLDLQTPLPAVDGAEGPFRQVLLALASNAAEALDGCPESTLLVATGTTRLDERRITRDFPGQGLEPGLYVTLDVRDTGRGMDAEALARAFEPFFTTRATGRGLGLTATRDILRQHRAGISLASRPNDGTSVRVVFPASNARIPLAEDGSQPLPALTPLILVVDDDPILRQSAVEALEGRGYAVIQARDGVEAVEVFQERATEVALVLLDVAMPRKDGREALADLIRIRPGVRVVLCSGYHEQEVLAGSVGQQVAGFLAKPYRVRELLQAVRGILIPEPDQSAVPGP